MDKKYHIEKMFCERVDLMLKRKDKNWDHLLLYDGEEGVGKSTCAIHHAYYIADRMGIKFTHENIFFDPEEMMKFASRTEGQVIMWDEAAFGGMSSQWQNQIQQKLIMCLMTARKKRHFWLFLIPELHKLNFYFLNRSVAVIHVYSEDDISRGKYVYIGKRTKRMTLLPQVMSAKKRMMNFKKYDFRGAWGKDALIGKLIDEDAYETAKDNAIRDAFSGDTDSNKWKTKGILYHYRLYLLYEHFKEKYGISQRYIAEICQINQQEISKGKELEKKYPDMLKSAGYTPTCDLPPLELGENKD